MPAPPSRAGQGGGGERLAGAYPLEENPLAGCSLCHVDVEVELRRSAHFASGVGCRTCHGPSEGHLADENNEVKPDHVFSREAADPLCRTCHACRRPREAREELSPGVRHPACTECHGSHALELQVRPGG